MKCSRCGKEIEWGDAPDGMPNGVQMIGKNGKIYTACHDCIVELGAAKTNEEKKRIIGEMESKS